MLPFKIFVDIDDVLLDTMRVAIEDMESAEGHHLTLQDLRRHPTRAGWLSLEHAGVSDAVLTKAVQEAVAGIPLLVDGALAGLQRIASHTNVHLLSARPESTTRRTIVQLEAVGILPYASSLMCVGSSDVKGKLVSYGAVLIDDHPVKTHNPRCLRLFTRPWNLDLPHPRLTWYDVSDSANLNDLLEI